jgi:sulfate permease, SulP family
VRAPPYPDVEPVAAAKYLEEMLPKADQTTHAVVAIGLRGQTEAGSTFMSVLQRYAEALKSRDSKLMLVGVDAALSDQLAKTGVLALIGEENVFAATPQFGGAMNKAAAGAYSWLGEPRGVPRSGCEQSRRSTALSIWTLRCATSQ